MSDPVTEKNTHDDVPVKKKYDELHALIDGIEIAMLTTVGEDGALHARAMATQKRSAKGDIWFVTTSESGKVADLADHTQVNVSYINGGKEWVSIAATATVSTDRERIRAEYRPEWKAWFDDRGGAENGGPDDPRIALIDIHAHDVTYFKVGAPRPIVLFKIAVAAISKSTPDLGAIRHIPSGDL